MATKGTRKFLSQINTSKLTFHTADSSGGRTLPFDDIHLDQHEASIVAGIEHSLQQFIDEPKRLAQEELDALDKEELIRDASARGTKYLDIMDSWYKKERDIRANHVERTTSEIIAKKKQLEKAQIANLKEQYK